MKLWDPKKLQAASHFASQERSSMFQGRDGFGGVGAFVHPDSHQGVPLIGRDLDAGNSGRGHARVRKLVADQLGELLAESFRDALFAMLHLFKPLDTASD